MSTSDRFEDDPEFTDAPSKPRPRPRAEFRPIRVVAALGIVGLVAVALLLPATRSSGPAARRAQCTNNLKQIALALHQYEEVYHSLPPAYTADAGGRPLHSWRTLILPYLEQESLYRTIDLSKPWNDPANARARETAVPTYRCPESAAPPNTTTYLAIVSPDTCWPPTGSRRLAEITDDHRETLMVIEAGEENAVPWMAPLDAGESLVLGLGPDAKLHHAGGTNAAFMDGSVRFLKAGTPAAVRRAAMSISGHDDEVAREW